jgi:hypothetical protein
MGSPNSTYNSLYLIESLWYAFRIPHSAFRIPHSAFRIPHSAFRIPHSAFTDRCFLTSQYYSQYVLNYCLQRPIMSIMFTFVV